MTAVDPASTLELAALASCTDPSLSSAKYLERVTLHLLSLQKSIAGDVDWISLDGK